MSPGSGPGSEAFAAAPHTHAQGRAAESVAAAWLEEQGYRILDRNATTPAGEIDVIARDGDTLAFIEIKARAGSDYGSPLEAVTAQKQRRLGRAAALYLALNPWDGPCRFDVLGLLADEAGWSFELVRDAFFLTESVG